MSSSTSRRRIEEIKAGWLLGVCMAWPGQMASTGTASTACFAWLPVHVCEPPAVAGTYKMPSRTRLDLHDTSLVDHVYQFITVQAQTWKARHASIPCNKQSGWFIERLHADMEACNRPCVHTHDMAYMAHMYCTLFLLRLKSARNVAYTYDGRRSCSATGAGAVPSSIERSGRPPAVRT